MLRGMPLKAAFLGHVRPGAGQAGKVGEEGALFVLGLRRQKDGKLHRRAGGFGMVRVDALRSAEAPVLMEKFERHGVQPASERHDRADGLSFVHQVESIVDPLQRDDMGDQIVDVDLPFHVPLDHPRHVGAATGATERASAPGPSRDELKGPGGDLLTGTGDTDDDTFAPTLVAALEGLTHQPDVADALECVVRAASGEIQGRRMKPSES